MYDCACHSRKPFCNLKSGWWFPDQVLRLGLFSIHTRTIMRIFAPVLLIHVLMLAVGLAQAEAPSKRANESTAVLSHQKAQTAGFSYLVQPTPSWVAAVPRGNGSYRTDAAMHYEFLDEQVRVEGDGAAHYRRSIRVVNAPAGLGPAAQFEISFDPSYQVLIMHKVGLWRGGRYIDKLDRKKVQLLRRETSLEYQIYDGQVTASVVLDDVRVGDRVDYSYTVRGSNPVFDGKFVHTAWPISQLGPIEAYQFRLLAPETRNIQHRVGDNVKVTGGLSSGIRETIFRRDAVPQYQGDPNAPDSAYIAEQIQLSEFADWNAVARWGEKLFARSATGSVTLTKEADRIRSATANQAERLQRALDFVQTEVRYFGMEIGPNSHRPTQPGVVIEQRFGDCKDKVSLLIALLKELNIDAAPVLVSTRYRDKAASMLPGPLAFNHAIARVELEGKVYWLDGTRVHQTGPLVERQTAGLGKALVLQEAAVGLVDLPGTLLERRATVDEIFSVEQFSSDPIIDSRITYHGEVAEFLRTAIASQPIDKIETEFASEYARLYPTIQSRAPIRIEELPNQNAVAIVQRFGLPKFWTFPDLRLLVAEVSFWGVAKAVTHPNETKRTKPFRIQLPGVYRHTVVFNFPEDVYRGSESSHFEDRDKHYDYRVTYDSTARSAKLSSEMRLLSDTVSVDDWAAYTDKLAKLRPRLAGRVTVPTVTLRQSEKLQKDLRQVEESMNGWRANPRVVTPVQMNARMRQVVVTAQLDSGRLSTRLRAEALIERGIQFDNMGLPESGAADFDEALRLAPDEARMFRAAAFNAFLLDRDVLARERLETALKLAPSETAHLRLSSLLNFSSRQYPKAKQDLLEALKNSPMRERGYSALWLYLAARHIGEDGAAAVKEYASVDLAKEWPYPVLQFLMGTVDYDHALAAAKDGTKDPSRLCELYFYAGQKYLLDGENGKALEFFQKSLDTGVVEFTEYTMSKRSLQALGAR